MAVREGFKSAAASAAGMLTPTPVKTPFSHAQIIQFALEEQRRDKSLELFRRPTEVPKKRKKESLIEEDYVTRLGSIIRRDYYPDIERLQAKSDYLQALERNDVAKIRELQMLYASPLASLRAGRSIPATPMINEIFTSGKVDKHDKTHADVLTPRIVRTDSDVDPKILHDDPVEENSSYDDFIPFGKSAVTPPSASMIADEELNQRRRVGGLGANDDADLSISQFQSKYNSEDNASFDDIQDRDEQRRQEKYSWMYKISDMNTQLVLPNAESTGVVNGRKALPDLRGPDVPADAVEFEPDVRPNRIELWAHKPHNAVMFKPVAAPLTNAEVDELLASRVHVNHANTRFSRNVWKSKPAGGVHTPLLSLANSSSASHTTTDKQLVSTRETMNLAPAAAAHSIKLASIQPRIGVDGSLVHAGGSLAAAASGRALVSDPSPVPGIIDASPIITWGAIEGTPLALAEGETPLHFSSSASGEGSNQTHHHYTVQKMSNRDQLHLNMIDDIAKRRKYEREAVKPAFTVAKKGSLGLSGELGRLSNMSSAAQRLATQKLRIGTPMRSPLTTKAFPSPASANSVRSNATPSLGNSSRSSLALNVNKRAK